MGDRVCGMGWYSEQCSMVQFSPRALTSVLLLFGFVLAHVALMLISSNSNTLRKKNCQQISSLAP